MKSIKDCIIATPLNTIGMGNVEPLNTDPIIAKKKIRKKRKMKSFITYLNEKKKRVNDKGETVPDVCPKCGSKIGVYLKGEPVFLCSNPKCNEYFGILPFPKNLH